MPRGGNKAQPANCGAQSMGRRPGLATGELWRKSNLECYERKIIITSLEKKRNSEQVRSLAYAVRYRRKWQTDQPPKSNPLLSIKHVAAFVCLSRSCAEKGRRKNGRNAEKQHEQPKQI